MVRSRWPRPAHKRDVVCLVALAVGLGLGHVVRTLLESTWNTTLSVTRAHETSTALRLKSPAVCAADNRNSVNEVYLVAYTKPEHSAAMARSPMRLRRRP